MAAPRPAAAGRRLGYHPALYLDSVRIPCAMPGQREMSHEIVWEERGVVIRYHGEVSAAEVHATVEAVGRDARFDLLRYRLNDFRDVTHYGWTDDDLRNTAAISWAGSLSKKTRVAGGAAKGLIANVIRDRAMAEPIERYFALGMVPYLHGVFYDLASARAWIAAQLDASDQGEAQ